MNSLAQEKNKQKEKLFSNNIEIIDDKKYYYDIIPSLADIICKGVSETNKNKIEKIYLFGSYAYGNPNEDSDLDICVIMEDEVDIRWEYVYIVKELRNIGIYFYDVLVYRKSEFFGSYHKESIENVIIKKGKILYERA
jgi:predicted nucleotidyltransferase